MTSEVIRMVRKKRKKWKKYLYTRCNQDLAEYVKCAREVKKIVKKTKKNFEKKLAQNAKSNPRAFFKYLGSKKSNRERIGPLKINGECIDSNADMADALNDFFSSVFTVEDKNIVPELSPFDCAFDIGDVDFSTVKVIKKIKKLKKHSAPGSDGLRPLIFIELCDEIAIPLSMIFSLSYKTGQVPTEWKSANVSPIFKKGSKASPGNYRPVSLTSVACKLMESMIKDTIVEHLSKNKLIFSSQHGFMQKKSCLTNLLEYTEQLLDLIDSGKPVDMVYLDFAKAFDKVPHHRLKLVLTAHGIKGEILNWIVDWLTNRRQCVVLNGESSKWRPVTSGVPQGSVLGPVLFTIFINTFDIPIDSLTDILSKFADDTKVGRVVISDNDHKTMQSAIDLIMKWSREWQMDFNISKCKILHFGRSNQCKSYLMDGQPLKACSEETDIGVIISNDLKPSLQCAAAAKKANMTLGRMARAVTYRDRHVWLRLYQVYVRPQLEYAIQAWRPWLSKDINLLESVQKRAIRMTSGLKGRNYEEKLHELGMQSLEDRRTRGDAIQIWKILNNHDNVSEDTWFTRCIHNSTRDTRQSVNDLNLEHKTFNTDIRKNSFSVRGSRLWNSLPNDLRSSMKLREFKARYDEIYIHRS